MTYEHQERYRRRTLLKARYFELLNDERLRKLRWDAKKLADQAPEVRACIPYFLSHPLATYIPHAGAETHEGPLWWYASVDRENPGDADFHGALMRIALTSVTSSPVQVMLYGDGWGGPIEDDHPDVIRVRKEIEELRSAGMWVHE